MVVQAHRNAQKKKRDDRLDKMARRMDEEVGLQEEMEKMCDVFGDSE